MISDWPFVSIVVPVRNGSSTIDALLNSLLEIDYPVSRYEILVVDNNSTDDTRERVQRYPVTLLEEVEIQSSYAARNRGIKAAKGEMLAFTDADCVVSPSWLKRLLADHANSRWGGFSGSTRAYPTDNLIAHYCTQARVLDISRQQVPLFRPDGMGERLCSLIPFLDYRPDISLAPNLISPHTANVAYRRSVLEQLGCFDQHMFTGSDFDLAWRLQSQTNWQILLVPDAIVYHQHRTDLPDLLSMYRRYGNGYAVLGLKYSKVPARTARQLVVSGLFVAALTIPAHLLKFFMLPLKAASFRSGILFWSAPILEMLASVYYNYGKTEFAWRWLRGLSN